MAYDKESKAFKIERYFTPKVSVIHAMVTTQPWYAWYFLTFLLPQ